MLFLSKMFFNFARQQEKKTKKHLEPTQKSVFSWSGCDRTDELPLRRRKRWELQKGLVMGAAVVVVWTGHSLDKRSAKSDTRDLYTLDAFFFSFFVWIISNWRLRTSIFTQNVEYHGARKQHVYFLGSVTCIKASRSSCIKSHKNKIKNSGWDELFLHVSQCRAVSDKRDANY